MKANQAEQVGSLFGEARRIGKQVRQIWRLVPRRYKMALAAASVSIALVSACNTVIPLLLGKLLDSVKSGIDEGLSSDALFGVVGLFLGLIAGAIVVREGLQVLRRYLVERSCSGIEKMLTVQAFARVLKADLATLTEDKIGALEGRISRGVHGFARFVQLGFLDFLPPFLTGVFALATAFSKQPVLGLTMAGVVPISLLLTLRQLRSQTGIRLELIRGREDIDGTMIELLGGLDYVRAANMDSYETRRLDAAAERHRLKEDRHHWHMSLYGCGKVLNEAFFSILVLAVASYQAVNGVISYGDILTFSFLFNNVIAPLNEVHHGLDEGHECSLKVADLLQMLEEPPDRSFLPAQVREPQALSGRPILAMRELTVAFPGVNGGKRALDRISMNIAHGETIGLAGPSGSGKTTWLRVILRLTHPTEGQAFLGGVPLEEVSREAIGKLIGYVGQSPFVFAGTVEENIRYGNLEAKNEAVIEAAHRACIHDEILQMPGGYQAMIKERGLNLSGGQRQRLALARVFLADRPIIILDEGTSALDTISERNIQRAIDLARNDRTIILVAHRLSSLLDADRIYVFQDSHIVEEGSYADLYRNGGEFARLVASAEVGVTDVGKANGQAVH